MSHSNKLLNLEVGWSWEIPNFSCWAQVWVVKGP